MWENKAKITALSLLLIVVVPIFVLATGNDFIIVDLSVDDPSVTTGQYLDYRHFIYANDAPNAPVGDFTTGWFSVNLAQGDGSTYSKKFSQVGIMTYQGQAKWFVYAEPGVTCLQGTEEWPIYWWIIIIGYRGCSGNFGDYGIAPGNLAWTRVEAVTYSGQSWWILRIYDVNGVAHDVAKANDGSKQIYRAEANSEEGYAGSTDPHYLMDFYHYHPEYWKPGVGFTLWPEYDGIGQNNRLWTAPGGICPNWYGAEINVQGNSHLWRTVSGGPTCDANPLF